MPATGYVGSGYNAAAALAQLNKPKPKVGGRPPGYGDFHVPGTPEQPVVAGATPPPANAGTPQVVNPGLGYLADPVLQGVIAAGQRDIKSQYGSSLASIKDLLLGFGSQQIARDTLGGLESQYEEKLGTPLDFEQFYAGISDNPETSFSTLAKLHRAYGQQTSQTNADMNTDNTFFSGARAKALRELNYGEQADTDSATAALRKAIAQALGGNATVENQARDNTLGAEGDAYGRSLTQALAAGYDPTGGAAPRQELPPGLLSLLQQAQRRTGRGSVLN